MTRTTKHVMFIVTLLLAIAASLVNGDHYSTLGLSKSASTDDIRRAYKKLARQYHPDKVRQILCAHHFPHPFKLHYIAEQG